MGSLFPSPSAHIFFRLSIRYQVGPPQLQDLRKDLVDREHLELLQPLIDGAGNCRIRMPGHDVSHVLKDLQVLDLQIITILLLALIGLLNLPAGYLS